MKAKLFFVTVLFALLSACASGPIEPTSTTNSGTKTAGSRIKIGFAMDTLKEERWQRDHDAFKAHCEKMNVECTITVADNKADKQANDVDNLLTQGIDVLVIAPHDATQAASMVEKAKAQGVPVISYDRLINSDKIDVYVSHQVPVIGQQMAEYALNKQPKGNYVMVYGASTDNNAHIMKKAQLEVLHPAIQRGEVKILAEQFIDDWKKDLAGNFVENALTQNNDDIQALIVSNDGMAGGVIEALSRRGLAGKVLVTGQDAQLDALQSIAEGRQTMTVYKPIIPLANRAVEAAIKLANKEPLETMPFMNDKIGKEIRAVLLEVTAVDKSNLMETVIKDGYATFENVYKNVPEADRPRR